MSSLRPPSSAGLLRYHLFSDLYERFLRRRGTTTNTPTTLNFLVYSQLIPSPRPFLKGLGDTIACYVSYSQSPSSRGCLPR